MRKTFYPKLAWNGINKNKKLYLPYIITCVGMIMMYYIISFLSGNETIQAAKGGNYTSMAMNFGAKVIAIFAGIFLFYTNSFLSRQRKKEFGLYNILGMEKRNLGYVLICESIIITVISLFFGILAGIVFSKVSELCMLNLLEETVDTIFYVDTNAIVETIALFVIIFVLLLGYTLCQIKVSKPIELLRSEKVGEKPPKAKWLLAIEGIVILGVAYYMAITIEHPLAALQNFFIAVILVIIATYILFVAGSVTLCRLLQKNKKYYYKTNHFVSVSSMVYRMKRNGVGLASICILCTMVLIMLSSTACLYFGTESTLRNRYPRNVLIRGKVTEMSSFDMQQEEKIRTEIAQIVEASGEKIVDVLDFDMVYAIGDVEDGEILLTGLQDVDIEDIWQVYVMPIEQYHKITGSAETLQENEVVIYADNYDEIDETILLCGEMYQIKEHAPEMVVENMGAMQIISSVYVFTPVFDEIKAMMEGIQDKQEIGIANSWYYGFDLKCADEKKIEIYNQLTQYLNTEALENQSMFYEFSCECVAKERDTFFGMYGNLLFLGILLAIVFVAAAVLIIYYKQISEGYEDQARFEIMQKVGMSKDEIKKSINSQVLTVFVLPILVAGLHLMFAFPMLEKLLAMLDFYQRDLLIMVTVACFLIFGLLYLGIYYATSKAYYAIVSGRQVK